MATYRNLIVSLAIGLVVTFATQALNAQIVPFRTVGPGGVNAATGDFAGSAQGIHLGACNFAGNAVLTPYTDLDFSWTATDTYTGANGDQIFLTGIGTIHLFPMPELGPTIYGAKWFAEWEVVGGTGRFENAGPADEPITMIANNLPFDIVSDPIWYFTFEKIGEFDLGKKKKK